MYAKTSVPISVQVLFAQVVWVGGSSLSSRDKEAPAFPPPARIPGKAVCRMIAVLAKSFHFSRFPVVG